MAQVMHRPVRAEMVVGAAQDRTKRIVGKRHPPTRLAPPLVVHRPWSATRSRRVERQPALGPKRLHRVVVSVRPPGPARIHRYRIDQRTGTLLDPELVEGSQYRVAVPHRAWRVL